MTDTLPTSVRELPSALDVLILRTARAVPGPLTVRPVPAPSVGEAASPGLVPLLTSTGAMRLAVTPSTGTAAGQPSGGPNTEAVPERRPQDEVAPLAAVPGSGGAAGSASDPDAIDAVFNNPLGWRDLEL
jgi:hypothetical protein